MDRAKRDTTLVKPLTSVRFFAAMAVVIFHSGASFVRDTAHAPGPVKTLLLNGYAGVTFFFVLSGFILHYTYQGSVTDAASLKRYGIARFARIYPVYLLAVLAMIPFIYFSGWGDLPQFFLLHWWPPAGTLPWTDWNMPSWTLSVEFFFYLCFPLLSALVLRLDRRMLLGLIVVLLAFSAVTASSSAISGTLAVFKWMRWIPIPILRLPEFLIGICAAELHLRRDDSRKFPVPAWLPAAALVVGLCLTSSPRIATWATAMSVLMISAMVADRGSLFTRVLASRWLVLLGGASYSLYLLHQPVHFGVVALLGKSKLMVALQYPILIALSVLVFLLFEEPVREAIRKWTGMKPSAIEPVAAHPVG